MFGDEKTQHVTQTIRKLYVLGSVFKATYDIQNNILYINKKMHLLISFFSSVQQVSIIFIDCLGKTMHMIWTRQKDA